MKILPVIVSIGLAVSIPAVTYTWYQLPGQNAADKLERLRDSALQQVTPYLPEKREPPRRRG